MYSKLVAVPNLFFLRQILILKGFEKKKNLKKNFFLTILAIPTLIFYILFFHINFFSSGLNNFMFYFCAFLLIYWLLSIFTFLMKKSQYSVYVSSTQRFWKRAWFLFWILELVLFIIFLSLSLTSPDEVLFLFGYSGQYFNFSFNLIFFLKTVFNALIVILIGNISLLLVKYKTFKNIFLKIILILLIIIFMEDFSQFFNINQFYNAVRWNYNDIEKCWLFDKQVLKLRTNTHYMYILVVLKIWHTLFILAFFLFLENFRLNNYVLSFGSFSSNLKNFFFLYFFTFILKINLIKSYLNHLFQYVYTWFYVNYHLFDLNFLKHQLHMKVLSFIIDDFICILY